MENKWILHAGRMIETPSGSFTIRRGDDWQGSPCLLDDAARLVAAAPELLAALRECRAALDRANVNLPTAAAAVRAATAAIANATPPRSPRR
jgi:hypothetical protein